MDILENGTLQGLNDSRNVGYMGPYPPGKAPHHYHFKLYGLDTEIETSALITKKELPIKMKGHVIAKGELVGLYERK